MWIIFLIILSLEGYAFSKAINVKVLELKVVKLERDIKALTVSYDNRYIIGGGNGGSIYIWNINDGKKVKVIKIKNKRSIMSILQFNGRDIVAVGGGYRDGSVHILDIKGKKTIQTLLGHRNAVSCLDITSDNKYIVSGSWDGSLRIWKQGKNIYTLNKHKGEVRSVVVSNNNKYIISGGWDKIIRVWSLKLGKLVEEMKGSKSDIRTMAISSDDKLLFTAGGCNYYGCKKDFVIYIWDLKRKKIIKRLKKHTNVIKYIFLTSDDKYLISAGWDKTIYLWNTKTGKIIGKINHKTPIRAMSISLNAKYIVATDYSKKMYIWKVKIK
jgi:WD40 repeat protein